MPSIGDSWPVEEVTKNIFSTSNTSHLIIMMISVVLCKICEKINYLSIFHDHVVRIWLRNWPAKLSWNRNKNSQLQMLCLEYSICRKLMWFYRNTVLFHIIFVVTLGEIFGHLGHTGPLTVKTKWRCRRCIGGDCVVFLLLLKEIRLQLSYKASQQVLLQCVSHTAETDKVSLVLWSTVSQNLRPLGAARTMWVYFALCQQSTLKSQNSGCVLYWRFWPNWWSEKIRAGNSPKSVCVLY